jgi:hypothetical protein
MSRGGDVERRLDAWLAEGPVRINDRVVESALREIEHRHQRRVFRVGRRRIVAETTWRSLGAVAMLGVIAVVGLAIVATAALLVGTLPSPTPGIGSPAPSPSSPGATPSRFGNAVLLGGKAPTAAGATYYTDVFTPAFTVQPGIGWYVDHNLSTIVSIQSGPGSPSSTPTYVVQILQPNRVVQAGTAGPAPAPSDLIAWLQGRPDLTVSTPTPVNVGGIAGTRVDASLRAGAALNPEGIVNLICSAQSNCGYEGGELIAIGPPKHGVFVVVTVQGMEIVISLEGPVANSPADQAVLDAVLTTLAFPSP